MLIVEQPNKWSCVPAAFATATQIPIETLLKKLGHDGSEIIFPDLEEPLCRRAFQVQELSVVLWSLGFAVGHYDIEPLAILDEHHIYTITYVDSEIVFQKMLSESIGVGCGRIQGTEKTHAFAWNGKSAYDPCGFVYPITRYEIYSYHPIFKRPMK
jgi:hypothetical protein